MENKENFIDIDELKKDTFIFKDIIPQNEIEEFFDVEFLEETFEVYQQDIEKSFKNLFMEANNNNKDFFVYNYELEDEKIKFRIDLSKSLEIIYPEIIREILTTDFIMFTIEEDYDFKGNKTGKVFVQTFELSGMRTMFADEGLNSYGLDTSVEPGMDESPDVPHQTITMANSPSI